MERKPKNLHIEVRNDFAIESVTYSDGFTAIKPPIKNVDSKNPNSNDLLIIRNWGKNKATNLGIPLYYHNFDLEKEILRIKRELKK